MTLDVFIKFIKTDRLADISEDIAQVLFASSFINPLLSGDMNLAIIMFGISFSCVFWVISMILSKK